MDLSYTLFSDKHLTTVVCQTLSLQKQGFMTVTTKPQFIIYQDCSRVGVVRNGGDEGSEVFSIFIGESALATWIYFQSTLFPIMLLGEEAQGWS